MICLRIVISCNQEFKMKRTDLERHQRELKKSEKKFQSLQKKVEAVSPTKLVGIYINDLHSLFRYDTEEIFNINTDTKILELLENMKQELPEKQWENIIRKGVKKTNINNKEKAVDQLKQLAGI